jgi:hypothetical protein
MSTVAVAVDEWSTAGGALNSPVPRSAAGPEWPTDEYLPDTVADWWAGTEQRLLHHVPMSQERRIYHGALHATSYCRQPCVRATKSSARWQTCSLCAAYVATFLTSSAW